MGLSRIGGATLLLAALSGCYQARVPAIESGDAVPFGDIASCKVRDKHLRFDLTHPEPTAGGGTIYRLGNETLAFKKLSDTLYLAQLNSSGMYRYGYVMRNGSGLEVLALRDEIDADPNVRAIAPNILFKPAQHGWQEMVATRDDLAAFLRGAKLGMMRSVGECSIRKAVPLDTPLAKGLRLSTTREQAMKLPAAEACDLGDVCLPLSPTTIERVPAAERAGVRIQVAFEADRVKSVTLTAKGISPANSGIILDDVSLGLSRFGPYDTPILLSFNNRRVDMLAVRQLAAWNPQRAAEQMRSLDQFKDVSATVRDPAFRSAEILIVPAEAFATIQGFATAEAAMADLRQRQAPYHRIVLKQSGAGKIDATLELVP
ncbi:hypothetical protein [Methylobacterium platani]|uniref:hypothetical protein n=1 Tax=Methylobacterium platani TaxID=427683 RepID=UPI000A872279|nr:hypothetical protein [Methylobacterium platani]